MVLYHQPNFGPLPTMTVEDNADGTQTVLADGRAVARVENGRIDADEILVRVPSFLN